MPEMSEEALEGLMEVIDAKIEVAVTSPDNRAIPEKEYQRIKQEWINTFVFDDENDIPF